jgi:formylglycine-generating enzyme required for sulfatase activity
MTHLRAASLFLLLALVGCQRPAPVNVQQDEPEPMAFTGSKAGDERDVAGVKLCWCPPGKFTMGSPPGEPERWPCEDQVEVALTRGFWAGKYEVTKGQHKDGEATQRLETCLAHCGHAPPVVREALMSDAAVFQARRRKRADLADQWLAAMPARTQHRWFRSRAEAAILEAKGDTAGALEKLAEVEAAIRTLPDSAQGETLLRLLEKWKNELGGA